MNCLPFKQDTAHSMLSLEHTDCPEQHGNSHGHELVKGWQSLAGSDDAAATVGLDLDLGHFGLSRGLSKTD
jgi:hypothetical protein